MTAQDVETTGKAADTYNISPGGPPVVAYVWLVIPVFFALLLLLFVANLVFGLGLYDPGAVGMLCVMGALLIPMCLLAVDASRRGHVQVSVSDGEFKFGDKSVPLQDIKGFASVGPKGPEAPESHTFMVLAGSEVGVGIALAATLDAAGGALNRHMATQITHKSQSVRVLLKDGRGWRRVAYGLSPDDADKIAATLRKAVSQRIDA